VRISSARFVKSARRPDDFPHDKRPEIAFCGRSNVGKSSLLNVLTNSKGLARTSATPGRTQTINFFLVNERLYFVDLPGYGYAKAPKAERQSWGALIERYLRDRAELRLAVILVDCRIPPTDSDRLMKEWLDHYAIPNAVVLTKADKLTNNQLKLALKRSAETLQTKETLAFSAVTGAGKEGLLTRIREALAENPTP
jgi:GTP-binding protein